MRIMTNGGTVATTFMAGLTLAGAGLGALPAHAAATSWHANVNNSTTFTGHNVNSAILSVSAGPPGMMSTPISAFCVPLDASVHGHISGNGKTGLPVQLGTILSAKFGTNTPCTLDKVITISAVLNMSIGVNASQSTTPHNLTSGVTKGWVGVGSVTKNPISATLTGLNLSCHVVVSGSRIPGSLSNTSGIFTINPGHTKTLHITSATGCLGAFSPGDPAGFFASYSTSPQLAVSGA